MRTSGARGAEGWILAIPLAAMFVAATMSNGGAHAMLLLLERPGPGDVRRGGHLLRSTVLMRMTDGQAGRNSC